jgi:hypothetical protein
MNRGKTVWGSKWDRIGPEKAKTSELTQIDDGHCLKWIAGSGLLPRDFVRSLCDNL